MKKRSEPEKNMAGSPIPKIIGMIHLLPLPGSPLYEGSMDAVVDRATEDCLTYGKFGIDAAMVENFGDVPFSRSEVPPVTVSSMTRVVTRLREVSPGMQLGVNVLRNDSISAISIAAATGAKFIRVNVFVGAVLTDQGIIEGKAFETIRLRRSLGADVKVLADVDVKHSTTIAGYGTGMQTADAVERGLADAVIVSGKRTGSPVEMELLADLRNDFPAVRILVGSGANARNVEKLLKHADGVIVGTSVKKGGITSNPIDENLLEKFLKAAI